MSMINDVIKSEVLSSGIEVYIQNSDGLCTSWFYHMIKAHT